MKPLLDQDVLFVSVRSIRPNLEIQSLTSLDNRADILNCPFRLFAPCVLAKGLSLVPLLK